MSWMRAIAALAVTASLASAVQADPKSGQPETWPPPTDRRAELIDPPRVLFDKDSRPDSLARSKAAVLNGAWKSEWVAREQGDGRVRLAFARRTHEAVVDVTYDATGFQIKYVSSINLRYLIDGGARRIHPNYNKWVSALSSSIQSAYRLPDASPR